MSKKKHQQNQLENTVETQNNTTTESQQNEQTDATNPQEYGRSMTEMLGVLAILGVLSIGGVQGYRYAMNKYHSNEVINELNILNAQLAIFMNGIHDDEAVMSLGEPYDNGEKINTGGYTFAYGCGQDPASTSPCDLDETGYYMTLEGIPEDVCKSVSQMTANMMNLVEQRINGQTDNDGILCQEENNQLTFLFDANDGQGFENGDGEGEGENDVTEPYYPDASLPSEEESTTTTITPETTTTTHTWTETETTPYNTPTLTISTSYYTGEGCRDNSHCGSGEYCYMEQGYSSTEEFSEEMKWGQSYAYGTCRNALQDAKDAIVTVGTNYKKLVSSNLSMTWWSAERFCSVINGVRQASMDDVNKIPKNERYLLDQKLGDFNWWITGGYYDNSSDHRTWFYFNGLELQISGYGRDAREHALCITNANVTNDVVSEFNCTSNSDCTSNEYCHTYSADCNTYTPIGGECRKVSYSTYTISNATLYKSNDYMSWWSVPNFCARVGGRMISSSDLGCYQPHSGYCSLNGKYAGGLPSFAKSVFAKIEYFWYKEQSSSNSCNGECAGYFSEGSNYANISSSLKDGSGKYAVCISGSGSGYSPEYTYPETTIVYTNPYISTSR